MSFTCPSCQNPAVEGQSNCIACGFSISEADQRLGIPPQLSAPVADKHEHLPMAEIRQISTLVDAIEKRFPQVHLAVVIDHVPVDVSMSVYTFWLFNRAGISSSVERGADNHLVLLVIDGSERTPKGAACMIGYGLESFVLKPQLDECLNTIAPDIAARRFGRASLVFFRRLQAVLQESCARAAQREQLVDSPVTAPSELIPSDSSGD